MRDWQDNVALSKLTTLKVGGPARYFARGHSPEELAAHLREAERRDVPVLILGEGSNLLVSDAGFDGLVLQLAAELESPSGPRGWKIPAGANWDRVVATAVDSGWAGIEALSGIPGLVGAAPIQNIGAYGQELSQVLDAVHVLDLRSLSAARIPAPACGLAYRQSYFKGKWRDRYVVTDLEMTLRDGAADPPRYAQLQDALAEIESPTVSQIRAAVLSIRRSKGMVLDANDPDTNSAGSFFTNPVVSPEVADSIETATDVAMPRYVAPAGRVKLSAAWLIEQAGFARGYQPGAAALSSKHTLAICNPGGATATDVIELALEIQQTVESRWSIRLAPEPRLLGFSQDVAQTLLGPF